MAAAHTVPREIREFGAHAFDPDVAAKIRVPVLLLVGADSPDEIKADPNVVAAALPDARIHVLAGQAHMAHLTDPKSFAEAGPVVPSRLIATRSTACVLRGQIPMLVILTDDHDVSLRVIGKAGRERRQ